MLLNFDAILEKSALLVWIVSKKEKRNNSDFVCMFYILIKLYSLNLFCWAYSNALHGYLRKKNLKFILVILICSILVLFHVVHLNVNLQRSFDLG